LFARFGDETRINGNALRSPVFTQFNLKKVDRGYLTEQKLNLLIKKKFLIKRLEQVRDIFVFSCFIGLAYIDVKKLLKDHIRI
jgi:hypothetical protein